MKVIAVFAFCLVISSWATNAPECTSADNARWLANSVKEMVTIHAGMTRHDLLRVFRPAGGFSQSDKSKAVFVYRESPYIKVDVEFAAPSSGEQAPAKASGDMQDVITSISRPYLAEAVFD